MIIKQSLSWIESTVGQKWVMGHVEGGIKAVVIAARRQEIILIHHTKFRINWYNIYDWWYRSWWNV